MKRQLITTFIVALLSLPTQLLSQNTLTIIFPNLKNNKGVISMELFNKAQQSIKSVKAQITNKRCTVIIHNLPTSKYGIRYIHDEDNNGELATNFLGIPTEGYGFSNNAYGTFGPYDFEKWLFEVDSDTRILLRTKY